MMTNSQYHDRELLRAIREIDALKAKDRRWRVEAGDHYRMDCARPWRIADEVDHLLAGNYGYGAKVLSRRIADNPRMNRTAGLAILVAALTYGCDRYYAVKAYKNLSSDQKNALNEAIDQAIEEYEQQS